jgi:hypothetical protein
MDLHSLSGRTAYWAAVTGLWGVVAAAGCHSDAAGGRTPDAAVESRPDLMEKLPAPEANCPADAAGGGGDCPLNFCGQVKSVKLLQAEETATLGTDSLCTPGYVCVPDGATAAGTAVQLRCLPPVAGAAAFGQACVTGTNAGAQAGRPVRRRPHGGQAHLLRQLVPRRL